jgi:peptidoglycan/LPS O-acetylase OafA/YrhL
MRYRAEIDGLRAVAVVPVMLFHAGFDAFGGGFVGVDVFFVISGYLITSIILAEKQAGTFSLAGFYERRARRILPALFTVMAACIPFAWLWLLPDDMQDFSRSLVAVSVFASNILFWRESGYFDAAAELKPLLHTWSLAVEEQYYLLYPLLLLLVWRLGRRGIAALLAVAALASLAFAQWGAHHSPAAAFFLLPARGWELAIGGLAALHLSRGESTRLGEGARQALSVLGLVLIFWGVFAYDQNTPFPSLYALVPTLGTVLLVLCATPATAVGRVLGSRSLVAVGLISYGAYLWHQPLLAFARYRAAVEPGALQMGALIVAAMVLAYFSWRFVERPLRRRGAFRRLHVFAGAACVSAAFIGFGIMGTDGYPARYSDAERQFLASVRREAVVQRMTVSFDRFRCFTDYSQSTDVLFENDCVSAFTGEPRIILFGDSHAAHLLPGIRRVFGGRGYRVEQYASASCRAIDFDGNPARCREFHDAFIGRVLPRVGDGDILLVSSNWLNTRRTLPAEAFRGSVRALLERLAATQAKVVLLGGTPHFHEAPQIFAFRKGMLDEQDMFMTARDNEGVNDLLREESGRSSSLFVDPMRAFCKQQGDSRCQARRAGHFLFLDAAHLSEQGSEHLAQMIWSEVGVAFPGSAAR